MAKLMKMNVAWLVLLMRLQNVAMDIEIRSMEYIKYKMDFHQYKYMYINKNFII